MITCPKCQVPNPDSASSCTACGAGLAGQAFAAALDRASPEGEAAPSAAAPATGAPEASAGAPPETAAPQPATPQAAAPSAPAAAPGAEMGGGLGGVGGLAGFDPSQAPDPSAAQHEINQFIAEQKSRKRNKRLIWVMVVIVAVAIAVFFAMRNAAVKEKREEVARFWLAFREIDDKAIADFYRCTVRAKAIDIRLAKDNLMLTDGLAKAFKAYPTGQPKRLTDVCLPELDRIAKDLRALKTPDGFASLVEALAVSMEETKTVFQTYVAKLKTRSTQAANEKTLMDASAAFHTDDAAKVAQAVGYMMVMHCAVPDLAKMARKVRKAPDTQKLIEFLFETCKSDKTFADKLRGGECFGKMKEFAEDPTKPKWYAGVKKKFAGDDRDRQALDYCFKKANRGFFFKELSAIGKSWVKYRAKRKAIMAEIEKYKEKAE